MINYLNHYEKFYQANNYDQEWRWLGAYCKADNITRLVGELQPEKIIDIGAGDGIVSKILSERGIGKEHYAVDISSSAVEIIKSQNIASLIEAKSFDGYHIPYEDKYFDLAICSHVIEHAENPRQLLKEIKRISKFCFIEVPLEDNVHAPRDFTWNDTGHINIYSSRSIRYLLQSCELIIQKDLVSLPTLKSHLHFGNKGLKFFTYMFKKGLMTVTPNLASLLLTYHYSCFCEC